VIPSSNQEGIRLPRLHFLKQRWIVHTALKHGARQSALFGKMRHIDIKDVGHALGAVGNRKRLGNGYDPGQIDSGQATCKSEAPQSEAACTNEY
jgi:hypothetical protein